jgi:5-methylcytosine-specific restriction endonuclease McrA
MPLNIMTLSRVDMPVSQAEGLKILERDQFCCRYCGLDGRANFENALVMSVDFVVPRARKGKKDPANLVACCRPCNMIKGTKVYKSFEDAKKYVLARREEMRQAWESKRSHTVARAASAFPPPIS